MKIYIQDCSWAGCIMVIAQNEEQARIIMTQYYNYQANREVTEHEIVDGFSYCNLGDS
jgi:phosphoribosyl-AMP cyclohydrolase